MILNNVTIESFGALTGIDLKLQEGLNIILGPNESGKSTIFHALSHCLLTSSKLTVHQFRKKMQRFIPIGGGDTIKVSLDFICDGKLHTLERSWGETKSSTLTLPEGSVISNPSGIKDVVEECMQVSEATSKSVMMTYQSKLVRTLDDLTNNPETLATLGDILRKAVMEMDGVSIDIFKTRVDDLYTEYFSRWDRDAKYPDRNRGIENPYKTSLGKVIESFYYKESIRKSLEAAGFHEKELDAINQKISEYVSELQAKEDYVSQFKKAKEDSIKRKQFESDFKACELAYDKLQEINRNWPVEEEKVKQLKKSVPELENKAQKLNHEKMTIQEADRHRQLVERFKHIDAKKKALDEVQKKLTGVKKITPKNVKKLRETDAEKQKLKASMKAGKLNFNLATRKEVAVRVQKGLEEEVQLSVTPEKPLSITADGRLQITHTDWDMEITSGEIDFAKMLKDYQSAERKLKSLLDKHRVTSVEQAEEQSSEYQDAEKQIAMARQNYESELGEDDYESIKKKVDSVKVSEIKKDLDTIIGELVQIQSKIEFAKQEIADLQAKLNQYKEDYESPENLLTQLVEIVGRKKETEKLISVLAPLPKGEDDSDAFVEKYNRTEDRVKELKDEKSELLQEKIRLESTAPDRSVEEYEKDLIEAEEHFAEVSRYGEAVARIQEAAHNLLAKIDSETYKTLEDDVRQLVSKITGGKYAEVEMEESLPSGFKVEDGNILTYDLLSTGTQDVLAIALRLAFAKQFLSPRTSFIMMDDPLVDLDPDRRSLAADVIREFAEDYQVILFTCHPDHAEQLGGELIKL